MDSGMWAAIVGSVILVAGSGVGVLFWTHMTSAASDAESARAKAHSLEVTLLEHKAGNEHQMRVVEVAFLEYKVHVANEYVKRGEHSAMMGEIFRKLDEQDKQGNQNFREFRAFIDGKFADIAREINNKQDRTHQH